MGCSPRMDLWTPQPSGPAEVTHWRIGPLDVWVRRVDDEWQVATQRGGEGSVAAGDAVEPPHDADWRRWAASLDNPFVNLTPLLPDRPVIVRPAAPLQILPGQEARFFVGVPMWVRLSVRASGRDAQEICQEYTVLLSGSWFGTPQEGELCYALKTRARRSLRDVSPAAHRIVCPLLLRNGSDTTLDFQRLCLRAPHLDVFAGTDHLWTNEGRVTFRGEEALSHIEYGEGAPPFDDARERLCEARERPEKGLVSKTFGTLRAFSPF